MDSGSLRGCEVGFLGWNEVLKGLLWVDVGDDGEVAREIGGLEVELAGRGGLVLWEVVESDEIEERGGILSLFLGHTRVDVAVVVVACCI